MAASDRPGSGSAARRSGAGLPRPAPDRRRIDQPQVSAEAESAARRRAVRNTEAAWRRVRREFGLLTGAEVSAALPSAVRSRHPVGVEQMRRAGLLLSARRGDDVRYPGFQFAPDGAVRPVVLSLRRVAVAHGWSNNGLILWMCAPCGLLMGRRPVDCLEEPDAVLGAATDSFGASW